MKVESFREAFAYGGLQSLPDRAFAGTAGQNFEDAFYGCAALTGVMPQSFDIHLSSTQTVNLAFTFQACPALVTLAPGLFETLMPNIASLYNTFNGCSSLTGNVSGLLTGTPACTDFRQMFSGCRNMTGDINEIFTGSYPSGSNLLNLFSGCSRLTSRH
ncbi:TPA: hypothetical protein ACJGUQ_003637 [Salmonella enterica subsp. enterica serovar Ball]